MWVKLSLKRLAALIKVLSTRPPLRPTREGNYLVCLQLPECPYRICIGNPHRSLLADRGWPNTRLLPHASFRPRSFSRAMGFAVAVALVRWPGNVEWLCGDSQSRGSNECLPGLEVLLQQGSELAHLPTSIVSQRTKGVIFGSTHTRSIQNPPLLSIISKKSLYSLLRNQSRCAISKLLQK